MIHLEWPELILALPLPFLIRWLLPAHTPAKQAALIVPFLDDFSNNEASKINQNKQWPLWLAYIAWLALIFACMRPQWLGEPIEQAINGRDLMLAIDLSGSMKAQDFIIENTRVDRLTATKIIASQFIDRRVGDRLGLILFGSQAYLQTPLTFDRTTVSHLLQESALRLAGNNTAIGDAIGLAVKRLRNQKTDTHVLILLTDGANTAGEVTPLKAAELAAESDLKIYTIGMGAERMVVRSFFGNQTVNPSKDLDETTLKSIAEKTGGRYFRARNTEELNQIYEILDELEPIEKDKQFFRPKIELFHWALALSLTLTGILSIRHLNWKTLLR